MKKLIREVMLSRAYQLSSEHSDANYAADPDNTLVWRMNRRRLEAEAIRDAVLYVAGSLDLQAARTARRRSRSRRRDRPPGQDRRPAEGSHVPQRLSADRPRHGARVPQPVRRGRSGAGHRPARRDHDRAAGPLHDEQPGRARSRPRATAERLLADSRLADDAARVDYAFRLALGRPADAQQRADVLAFVKNYETTLPSDMKPDERRLEAWTSVCQTLLASAEFRYVY